MVQVLGFNFPERQLVSKALTSFYGISSTSRNCFRKPPAYRPDRMSTAATSQTSSSSSTSPPSSTQSPANPVNPANPPNTRDPSDPSIYPPQKRSPAHFNLLSRIMAQHYIHPRATLGDLTNDTLTQLTATLSELTIENDLRRRMQGDIARLRDMGAYRGKRHIANLPVRGQRTRSQISTARKLNRLERRN